MSRKLRTSIIIILTGLFYLFIQSLISHVALSSFNNLSITIEFDHDDRVIAFFSASKRTFFSQKRLSASDVIPAGKITQANLKLKNHLARRLRLDPGNLTGHIRIYEIRLDSFFGSSIVLSPEDIFERFTPSAAIENYRLEGDHVSLDAVVKDPQLIVKDDLIIKNRFISIVVPIALTVAFFLALSHFGRSSFPAFYDLSHHKSSANINYASLDGVRGVAVLLVLLDHSWGLFTGAGTAGVWIFFVLSGFLLAIPFVKKPEIAVSYEYMNEYLLRRLKRILPMYYFFIILTFFFFGKYQSEAFRHLLFLQGDGHLWTIPQEMLFYLFLPFIMIINYVIFRGRAIWIITALAVLMVLSNLYLDKSVLSMYGEGETRPAFAGIFICGILFSYIYHGVIAGADYRFFQTRTFKSVVSILGIILLLGFILLSTDTLLAPKSIYAFRHFGWFGVAAGMIILLVLIAPGTLYDRLLSWLPLRAVGLVGFSFYLLHPFIITLVKGMQDYYLGFRVGAIPQLFVVLLITYFLSAFTYSYIERPFLKLAKK
jgi:peptidoglycan/LPS O-acetylase OafA/YrhL